MLLKNVNEPPKNYAGQEVHLNKWPEICFASVILWAEAASEGSSKGVAVLLTHSMLELHAALPSKRRSFCFSAVAKRDFRKKKTSQKQNRRRVTSH